MQLSPRWDFRHCSRVGSITNRTAVYGSVRTVVWEGRRSDPSPYPDQECCHCLRITMVMKMGQIGVVVEVVARTGYGKAVRVFDLGPRDETMSRGPGDRIAGRTCEGDCNYETGPLPRTITRRAQWNQYIVR